MNDGEGFIASVGLVIAVFFLTWTCADQSVVQSDMDWAASSCAANGGLKRLHADIADMRAVCTNGATFKAEKGEWSGERK